MQGIAIIPKYKYLGVIVDDCADMAPMKDTLKQKQNTLKRQLAMTWAGRLNTKMRHLAWQSLLKSKVMYGVLCLAHH